MAPPGQCGHLDYGGLRQSFPLALQVARNQPFGAVAFGARRLDGAHKKALDCNHLYVPPRAVLAPVF